jgi:anti-sigma B factor antagonist
MNHLTEDALVTAMGAVGAHDPPSVRSHRHVDVPFTELGIDLRCESRGIVVALTGELDVATAPVLGSRLEMLGRDGHGRLVIDVSALIFCDCSGLGTLVRAHRRAARKGGWVRLCGAAGGVERIVGITRVSSVLRCYADVAAALTGG